MPAFKMSFHCDNIHTTVFTPRDYQVELLASAYERNTMICLGHKSSQEFIALKLLQEYAKKETGIILYITTRIENSMHTILEHLTNLDVFQESDTEKTIELTNLINGVYIIPPECCINSLRKSALSFDTVKLIVLEDCHRMDVFKRILPIFSEFFYPKHFSTTKVLALAGPLHSAGCSLRELNAMLETLEDSIKCKAETASDIVTVLRYCSKPIEYIVQCAPYKKDELAAVLEDVISTRKLFLKDHRYDPFEIYNTDEFFEELKDIPDPKKDPLEFIDTLLIVLNEMGPWALDRVAVNMFHRIEQQKIKTPHERHYILLCLINTALFEIRAICDQSFRKFSNHKELVENYSSPKVLRLFEILRLFKPEEVLSENAMIKRVSQELDQMDFQKLSRSIEYSCHSVEGLVKQQLESRSIIENLDPIVKSTNSDESSQELKFQNYHQNDYVVRMENSNSSVSMKNRRQHTQHSQQGQGNHGRVKKRQSIRRQMRDSSDAADTLCALIFCNYNYIARVLFELLAEMSRHDADLKFLKCQFTTDRVADPIIEPKEAEAEHRRQEEVLKRFRIHDCNVLIGTSILEEGIDVPKCNLVIRWDPPTTYRSYVQCKGRARSSPAYHVILVAPKFNLETDVTNNSEQLSDRSHNFLCKLEKNDNDMNNIIEDSDTNDSNDDEERNKSNQFTIGSSKGIVKILNPEVITSQPPTATEITLKEIKDETLAIKANEKNIVLTEIKDDNDKDTNTDNEKEKDNDNEQDEIINIDNECKLNKTKNVSDKTLIIEDLDDIIMEINQLKLKNSKTKTLENHLSNKKSSPVNIEVKTQKQVKDVRIFQCLSKDVEYTCDINKFNGKISEMQNVTNGIVDQLAQYREIEKMLLQNCANIEPAEEAHYEADEFTKCIASYKPLAHLLTGATVDLSTSIALINKYCAKLPSDTFTKLTALWRCAKTVRNDVELYQYTLRLPINSPLKYDIVGLPMTTDILARRVAAFQACIDLHKCGELDGNLQPIGKEGFKAFEADWENFELEEQDEKIVQENSEPRPGTTKRRQYYYKRIASELCNCRPTAGTPCYLYFLDLTLQCPIPEEQNTRGRKIYPPEDAQQGFGILTLKKIPKVSSFPIFTRSGEVKVSIELSKERIILTEAQVSCINTFLNYTFTNVLRLQKFLMLFDPDSSENCVFIVPTVKTLDLKKVIDWQFLELIEKNAGVMPAAVPEEVRKETEFDANKFKDAVIMPWYRNQDQPQYFYVAEICPHLSPLSCFPGENYRTFKHYYLLKYSLTIQNSKQPLLDVDHTSARLNFLTPRYVNRKGVALPTSSEETKRAKRENLEQKQILVPELCTVHPFPASLWRTAVCLPCILYRINGLLLADDIRKKVSNDIGLGQKDNGDAFEWPMLDFGWSLSEVLKKSRENKQNEIQNENNNATLSKTEKEINVNGEEKCKTDDDEASESSNNIQKSANEIVLEAEKKLQDNNFIEIGTWSNDMANDISLKSSELTDEEDEEYMNILPSNVSFCDDQQTRYGSPTFWDVKETNFNRKENTIPFTPKHKIHYLKDSYVYYDSDDSLQSSFNGNINNYSSDDENEDSKIEFTSRNEAETIETEQDIEKRRRQLSIIQATTANERNYQETKNLKIGYNFSEIETIKQQITPHLKTSITNFVESTTALKEIIQKSGMLVKQDEKLLLPKRNSDVGTNQQKKDISEIIYKMFSYVNRNEIMKLLESRADNALNIEDVQNINLNYIKTSVGQQETFTIISSGDIFDNFNDKFNAKIIQNDDGTIKKTIKLNFESNAHHLKANNKMAAMATQTNCIDGVTENGEIEVHKKNSTSKVIKNTKEHYTFDYQPDLAGHPGPSPSIILQALTMSNANDGINLERLETIGDSFLKYAITTYLYITYENVHEGKLSHLRSKQVANLNLYRLGRKKMLGEYMIATKFEPHDNWLPPCYYVPKELEKALIEAKIPPHHWKLVDLQNIKKLSSTEICQLVREKADKLGLFVDDCNNGDENSFIDENCDNCDFGCFIPYNLVTQHSIPDKSVADCVEALIGAYLIECGPRGALLFMAWLGIRVLPYVLKTFVPNVTRVPGSTNPDANNLITIFGEWSSPKSPLLHYMPNANVELESMLSGFDKFEKSLGYRFNDRSYLLQAMTHASYSPNRLTDCYQRLEFLGDAVLDYLITRHLYEDPRQHSPGALTDLRSALVNNTIFASLAVRHNFHKYFLHLSPGLNEVIDRFVRIQNENGHSISEEYYLLSEEECDDAEDVEVPKALGDVFESIAGAIFLDSNMSLDAVWQVYSNMMRPEIEQFSNSVPKSPIRELLELEPETAKFGKPEKLADGRRVRVTVEVFCKGTFRGIGRNYRIAKCTAAKCALRHLKKLGLITKKD